ncbi:hypothetical protein BASA81_002301 [Batrachochytrium salamandrivorans]|nr:hypothetical protein BASA81_002301 [Batrachochytrium salamandrivorans]
MDQESSLMLADDEDDFTLHDMVEFIGTTPRSFGLNALLWVYMLAGAFSVEFLRRFPPCPPRATRCVGICPEDALAPKGLAYLESACFVTSGGILLVFALDQLWTLVRHRGKMMGNWIRKLLFAVDLVCVLVALGVMTAAYVQDQTGRTPSLWLLVAAGRMWRLAVLGEEWTKSRAQRRRQYSQDVVEYRALYSV